MAHRRYVLEPVLKFSAKLSDLDAAGTIALNKFGIATLTE